MKLGTLILAALLCGCAPSHIDPGQNLPGAQTSLGRADLLADEIQELAQHPTKAGWLGIDSLVDRLRSELWTLGRQVSEAVKDRGALIQQVEQKTRDQIAEHNRLKWFGWRTLQILFWAKLAIGTAFIGWIVLGVYSNLNPATRIAGLFFRNAPLAGPFMPR